MRGGNSMSMYEHPEAQNHIEDSRMEVTDTGRSYSAVMAGQGRWFILEIPLGQPIGTVWTDDKDALGFSPVRIHLNEAAPQFSSDFHAAADMAAELGSPVSIVFDAWAGYDTMAMASREIQSGDLAALYRSLQ